MTKFIFAQKRVFGATMLITGSCIGAGMIGLPIVSRLAGFMPSAVAMLFCYLFTTISGLLLLEATLWFDKTVNLPSIAEFTLGKYGKAFIMFLFLFLFYCLFVAYLDAGGILFADIVSKLISSSVTHATGSLICMIFVVSISYIGATFVDGINKWMVIAMAIAYSVLLAIGIPNINQSNLLYAKWESALQVVPILLICFGYQNLVPSITYYLDKNVKGIRIAIIIGNLLPFFVYFFWNYVIIGLLPDNLSNTHDNAVIVSDLLQSVTGYAAFVVFIVKSFSLFAMLTSFLPTTLSFVDFLRDGIGKYSSKNKLLRSTLFLYVLIFAPAIIITLTNKQIFLSALSFAGGFIDVILYGIMPAIVILLGRRMLPQGDYYRVFGNSITPTIILIISVVLLFVKCIGI